MATVPSTTPVTHNAAQHRYEILVEGHRSIVEYLDDGRRRVFTHTFVPDALRGRGIAATLVREALDDARREGRTVAPACSYVAAFIQRNPEYRDLAK